MYLFDRTSTKNLVSPRLGNRPMLDADLQLESDRPIINQPSGETRLQYGECRSIAMPIFAEAAAQAVRLLDAPLAILTTGAGAAYLISAIVGLERLRLLGSDRSDLHLALSGLEYCHAQTIGSDGTLAIANLCDDLLLAQSALHCRHGIQAYLGSPIRTAAGDLLGAISILDFSPRQFSDRESETLHSIGRWSASEFERKLLSQAQLDRWVGEVRSADLAVRGYDDRLAASEHDRTVAERPPLVVQTGCANAEHRSMVAILQGEDRPMSPHQTQLQFKLLTHLAQELRTPLTAVVGMTSVLQQEIYGTLNDKQKDYLEIVHQSGERLVAIVNEISELGSFAGIAATAQQQHAPQLVLRAVDVEMLCRLALQSLELPLQQKHLQVAIDLHSQHPADGANARIWVLDKDKVRQIIYYLCLSVIHVSAPHERISIHIANLTERLQVQIFTHDKRAVLPDLQPIDRLTASQECDLLPTSQANISRDLRIRLGLSLCQTLANTHGGKLEFLPTARGYQLNLPLLVEGVGSEDRSVTTEVP
jgi:hypothetical protein